MLRFFRRLLWRNFKRLFILALLLCIVGGGAYVWYTYQDDETKEWAELKVLFAMDFVRDQGAMPDWARMGIDALADKIPASAGFTVDARDIIPSPLPNPLRRPMADRHLEVLTNIGYTVGYDERMLNPAWVSYAFMDGNEEKRVKRPSKFETDIRTRAEVTHDHYTGSGYDRGHMAPNYGIGIQYGSRAQIETFLMSNIVPQAPRLNQGIWREFEWRVATSYRPRFKDVWIVTGPIYDLESFKRLKSGVAVPDRFFKIILDMHPEGIRALALIMPQVIKKNARFEDFITTIDEVETQTGLDFFSLLPDDIESLLEAVPQKRVW